MKFHRDAAVSADEQNDAAFLELLEICSPTVFATQRRDLVIAQLPRLRSSLDVGHDSPPALRPAMRDRPVAPDCRARIRSSKVPALSASRTMDQDSSSPFARESAR